MNWATCKLIQGKARVINLDLVKHLEQRGNSTVVTFIDGEAFSIEGTDLLKNLGGPGRRGTGI